LSLTIVQNYSYRYYSITCIYHSIYIVYRFLSV
jgi:hypothetical protein